MIVLCQDEFTHDEVMYGMGENYWGQLGKDPHKVNFI